MKKILESTYLWMLLLLVVVVSMSGCSEDDGMSPLAEPVPLKMTLNSTDLVMGEVLEITFDVTGTEEGKKAMNEDLNIKLSATTPLPDNQAGAFYLEITNCIQSVISYFSFYFVTL